MSTAAVSHWKNQAIEFRDKFKRFRESMKEQSEHSTKVVLDAVMMGAGGVGAAVLDEKMPEFPGIGGDSKMIVGLGLVGLSLLDMAGDYGEQAAALGGGMLAVVAHEQTKKALQK